MRPAREDFFWLNFPALALAGLAISFWTFHFTDAFDAIGGVLGAGGILVWLTVTWNLLPAARRSRFRRRLGLHLFQGKYSYRAIIGLTMAFFVVVSFRRTVQFTAVTGKGPMRVVVTAEDGKGRATTHVLTGGERRRIGRWVWFGNNSKFKIRVDGYPSESAGLRRWRRTDRMIPYSYLRPVLLLRAPKSTVLISEEERKQFQWTIKIGDGEPITLQFDGRPVWIGCDQSMTIPAQLVDRWEDGWSSESGARKSRLRDKLLNPQNLPGAPHQLESGTIVEVRFSKVDETGELRKVIIRPVESYDNIVRDILVTP